MAQLSFTSLVDGNVLNASDINDPLTDIVTRINSGMETDNIGALAITTAKIASNAVDGTKIAIGSDAQGDILYYNGTDYTRLAAGTSGQFLKTNGSAANPSWGQPGVLSVDTTETTVIQTSTAEETVISKSVPANTLSTNGLLRFKLWFDGIQNSGGNVNITWKMKYGSTTMASFVTTVATATSRFDGYINGYIKGDTATNAQEGQLEVFASETAGGATGTRIPRTLDSGTSAEDSTSALNFILTAQSSVSNGNIDITRKSFILENFPTT